jgi:hypothetical protein
MCRFVPIVGAWRCAAVTMIRSSDNQSRTPSLPARDLPSLTWRPCDHFAKILIRAAVLLRFLRETSCPLRFLPSVSKPDDPCVSGRTMRTSSQRRCREGAEPAELQSALRVHIKDGVSAGPGRWCGYLRHRPCGFSGSQPRSPIAARMLSSQSSRTSICRRWTRAATSATRCTAATSRVRSSRSSAWS